MLSRRYNSSRQWSLLVYQTPCSYRLSTPSSSTEETVWCTSLLLDVYFIASDTPGAISAACCINKNGKWCQKKISQLARIRSLPPKTAMKTVRPGDYRRAWIGVFRYMGRFAVGSLVVDFKIAGRCLWEVIQISLGGLHVRGARVTSWAHHALRSHQLQNLIDWPIRTCDKFHLSGMKRK